MDGLDELEEMIGSLKSSADAVDKSTRGGAGSPIEVRMAQAFQDNAAAFTAIASATVSISESLARADERVERQEAQIDALRRTVEDAGAVIRESAGEAAARSAEEHAALMEAARQRIEKAATSIEESGGKFDKSMTDICEIGTGTAVAICVLGVIIFLVLTVVVFLVNFGSGGWSAVVADFAERTGIVAGWPLMAAVVAVAMVVSAYITYKVCTR